MTRLPWLSALAAFATLAVATVAHAAAFDLAGPKLEVRVTHGGITLPIGQTPNLSPGDKLWIKVDVPPGQSVRYLLVAGFLRGATNPPPKGWFTSSETWTSKGAAGLQVTVPVGAQQAMLFLAPSTGGDFDTITGAVRQHPGIFVRASQALDQAGLDHSRLEVYLDAVEGTDPEQLKTISPILASTLSIKLDEACLKKATGALAACLTQDQDSLVLNDGHSISMVQALTSGTGVDLVQQLTATPKAGAGYYSPYISSVIDMARILDSFRTAQFQYIPTVGAAQGEQLSLLLNSPPSFQNPKSVLVVSLPAVEPPQAPPLHAVDPDQAYCLRKPGLALPAQGAPLVFSTGFAHDLVLHIGAGRGLDLPVLADAEKGGFTLDPGALDASHASAEAAADEGVIRGRWGFDPYEGPHFKLQAPLAGSWTREANAGDLVQGANQTVGLNGPAAACVSGVTIAGGAPVPWRTTAPHRIEVTLPLKDARPGPLTLQVQQYGVPQPDAATLQVYAELSRLENVIFYAGDNQARIVGDRLDQVASLNLGGAAFQPVPGSLGPDGHSLILSAIDPTAAAGLKPGSVQAKVALKDGRGFNSAFTVAAPRPQVDLIAKDFVLPPTPGALSIELASPEDAPRSAHLTFSIRVAAPMTLTDKDRIEVRAQGSGATTVLASGSGLTLQDTSIAVAEVDLAKAFDTSTFGPLQFRLVQSDGASDWRPLAVLVRLPALTALKCATACELQGHDLFLIDAIASEASFSQPVATPPGFTGQALAAPRPAEGHLYIRLRDDPAVTDTVAIPAGRKRAASPPPESKRADDAP